MIRKHGWFESCRFLLLVCVVFLLLPSANAQFASGVEGTVVDASGAAVPGAEVTATNLATQVAYRSKCNNLGVFRVPGCRWGATAWR